jgi:RNA polymerase sigma-70 factor (ECF subfamily)
MLALMGPTDTEKALIERAQRGDRSAFEDLTSRSRERLATLTRFRLGASLRAQVDVEDILQETYLRALESVGRFSWRSEDSFFQWLSGISRNVIREQCRRVRPAAEIEGEGPPAEAPSPSRVMAREERLDRLQRALDELPTEYKRVLRAVLVEKQPVTEIAHRLGKTPNAVSLLLLRANRKLRELLGDTRSLGLPDRGLDWGDSDGAR